MTIHLNASWSFSVITLRGKFLNFLIIKPDSEQSTSIVLTPFQSLDNDFTDKPD